MRNEARAELARGNGATETAIADLKDVEALTRAGDGVDGVFGIVAAFAEAEAGIATNLVCAAVRVRLRAFVFSSLYHPSTIAPSNHLLPGQAIQALGRSCAVLRHVIDQQRQLPKGVAS